MKISGDKIDKVIKLKADGITNAKISKDLGISISSVGRILKADQKLNGEELKAWVYKLCPNPRIIFIHFGDFDNVAKCVVRANGNHFLDKPLKVKRIDTSDEELFREI